MNATEIVSIFQKLDQIRQQSFLANLASELTVIARLAYEIGTNGTSHPAFIRSVNEMQHRILATLAKHIENDDERFPDNALFKMLVDEANTQGFADQFEFAVEVAFNRVKKYQKN